MCCSPVIPIMSQKKYIQWEEERDEIYGKVSNVILFLKKKMSFCSVFSGLHEFLYMPSRGRYAWVCRSNDFSSWMRMQLAATPYLSQACWWIGKTYMRQNTFPVVDKRAGEIGGWKEYHIHSNCLPLSFTYIVCL